VSRRHQDMTAAEQAHQALGWAIQTLQAQLEIDTNNASRSKNKQGMHQKIYHIRVVSGECEKARHALRQSAQLEGLWREDNLAPEDL